MGAERTNKERLVRFGRRLRALRQHAGLSRDQVARAVVASGVYESLSGTAVGHWERGTNEPRSAAAVAALEDIVGTTPGELLGLLGLMAPGPDIADRVADLEAWRGETDRRIEALLAWMDRMTDPRPGRRQRSGH